MGPIVEPFQVAKVILPERFTAKTGVPDAEATKIFWSVPVSLKIAKAFPFTVPVISSLASGFVVPIPIFPVPGSK